MQGIFISAFTAIAAGIPNSASEGGVLNLQWP
jgi:hypothetical protein